jgi:hypothetical protein
MLAAVAIAGAFLALAGASAVLARSSVAPVNTQEPVISGTAVEGSTLTGTTGQWSGTEPISYTAQWLRCPQDGGTFDGSNCSAITGATGQFYELETSDVGFRLRLRVTATNADGSTAAASNPTSIVKARALDKPKNTKAPTISGSLVTAAVITANRGTWTGSAPITYAYTWARCNTAGSGCSAIVAAAGSAYMIREADVGRTLRVQVTATNAAGAANAVSAQTGIVQQPAPAGIIQLANGEKSIPVSSVSKGERLVVASISFSPNVVTTRAQPIVVRIRVKDSRGYVVRDAVVFVRSTPKVTSGGNSARTATDGWVSYDLFPEADFPLRNRAAVQFFVKAYRPGDPALAGVSSRRLVQVRTAKPSS